VARQAIAPLVRYCIGTEAVFHVYDVAIKKATEDTRRHDGEHGNGSDRKH
jgi:hypothetical protein